MKTDIVATVGWKCRNPESIEAMLKAGMNVARLNMSYDENHEQTIGWIREACQKLGVSCEIMLDTKGPEIRIGEMKDGKVNFNRDDIVTFTTKEGVVGDEQTIPLSNLGIMRAAIKGGIFGIEDGQYGFEILSRTSTETHTEVQARSLDNYTIYSNRNIWLPGYKREGEFLSEVDKKHLKLAVDNNLDSIALSFVSSEADILEAKQYIATLGGKCPEIIAKIETEEGVENIKSILGVCDGAMVARGDLGTEMSYERVPTAQLRLLNACQKQNKPCIVATGMMLSMKAEDSRIPTRAEASDVAFAAFFGANAIMLSGETVGNKYPEKPIAAAKMIIDAVELSKKESFKDMEEIINRVTPGVFEKIKEAVMGVLNWKGQSDEAGQNMFEGEKPSISERIKNAMGMGSQDDEQQDDKGKPPRSLE